MSQVLTDLRDPAYLNKNIAAVRGLYAGLATGAFDSLGVFLTDDVEFELHDSSGTLRGHWSGRDAVLAAIRANFAKVDQQKPELKSMIADGSSVAVLFAETGVIRATGMPYRASGVQWFTLEDGKVRRVEEIISLTL